MSHLNLVADNSSIAHPFRTRRERLGRAADLGMYGISGGRMMPVVIPSSRPTPGSYADFARRAEERRNPTPVEDFVQAPCDGGE